jgi:hypothetical protein
MDYKVIEKYGKKYIEVKSSSVKINSEQDALDLISLCFEHGINIMVINDTVLSDDFFNLKTGIAGAIIQKLVNYSIKTGIVILNERDVNERFKEFALEANKGNNFRIFYNSSDTEKWISIL